jgi:hypothetical protein
MITCLGDQQLFQSSQQGVDHETTSVPNLAKHVFGYMMTQMTASVGIKKHGEAAVEALFLELAQLHQQQVSSP